MFQILLICLVALNGNVFGKHVRSVDPYNTPSTVIPPESLYYHTSETESQSSNNNYNQQSEYQQPKSEYVQQTTQYEAPKTYQSANGYYQESSPIVKFVFSQEHGNDYQSYQPVAVPCNCQQSYSPSYQYQSTNDYGERDANPHLHSHSKIHTHIHQKGIHHPVAAGYGVHPASGGYGGQLYPQGYPSQIHGHQTIHTKFRNGGETQENNTEDKKKDDMKKEKLEEDSRPALKLNITDPTSLDKSDRSDIVGLHFLQEPELLKPFLGRISNVDNTDRGVHHGQAISQKLKDKSDNEPIVGSTINMKDFQQQFDEIAKAEQSQAGTKNDQIVGTFNMNLSDAMKTPFAGQANQDEIDDMMASYNNFNHNYLQNNLDNHNIMQMF